MLHLQLLNVATQPSRKSPTPSSSSDPPYPPPGANTETNLAGICDLSFRADPIRTVLVSTNLNRHLFTQQCGRRHIVINGYVLCKLRKATNTTELTIRRHERIVSFGHCLGKP